MPVACFPDSKERTESKMRELASLQRAQRDERTNPSRRAIFVHIECHLGGPLAQLVEHLTLNQGVTGSIPVRLTTYARVAELADALDLGSSGVTPVGVQVPSLAPEKI
jgi:hypothetical protein